MRFRLTVWYSSLLLVFGVAFVVALNLAVRLDHQNTFSVGGMDDIQIQITRTGPGQLSTYTQPFTLRDAEDQIYSQNLDRLRTWSLLAVVGLAVASGVGGYVLSGMMLRPVREITRVASEISASNLGQRINHQGPDDELSALAKTFDSMIDRLETSFERQRQFVQDASHELRTPLAAIRTNIEVTEMDPDVTAEEYRSLVETVKTQTARLTRLSEDLLLLSSEDNETLEREPVVLAAIGHEVVNQLGPVAAAQSVTLRTEGDENLEIESNADLLYRCVFNLVDNAIKYSGQDTTVTIRTASDAVGAKIEVADNGAGIPADEIERIFDRFYRVDKGRSRRQGGSGLGLAIVHDLVKSLGGTVDVRSEIAKGSTFTIRLPLGHAISEPASTAQYQPAAQPYTSLS
ncbi:MAG: ATP-binding protein [Tepidiformaceae bacterium]